MSRLLALLLCLSSLAVYPEGTSNLFSLGSRYFQPIGSNAEIPNGVVTVTLQDRQGFIWVGTQNGLIRYDGYHFKKYTHDPNNKDSLGGNYIRALWQADDGKLWIGTITDGVSIFDPKNNTFERHRNNPSNPNSLSHNRVDAITGDRNGNIWIGTNGGLDLKRKDAPDFIHYRHEDETGLLSNHIRSLLVDDKNRLWIGSRQGLNRYDSQNNTFLSPHSTPADPESLFGQNVSALFYDHKDTLWIGTVKNGYAWINKANKFHRNTQLESFDPQLDKAWIFDINQPSQDEVWVATYGSGIHILNPQTGEITQRITKHLANQGQLSSNNISHLTLDHSGLLWIASWGGGLYHYNLTNSAFTTIKQTAEGNGLSNGDVLSIAELQNGSIWIGTQGDGIDVFERTHNKLQFSKSFRSDQKNPNALGDGNVKSIVQSKDGSVWVATLQSGLHQFNVEQQNFIRIPDKTAGNKEQILSLMSASDNSIWIASSRGLKQYIPKTQEFHSFSLLNEGDKQPFNGTIKAIVEDNQGTIWAGGPGGLYVKPGDSDFILPVKARASDEGLLHNNITDLLFDSKGQLWISNDLGINRMTDWNGTTATFESINKRLKLSKRSLISNLIEDHNGRIWSGSGMIDTVNWHFFRFNTANGFDIGGEWLGAYAKTRSGLLLFGGTKGMLVIDPTQFKSWNYNPPIVITQAKIDAQPIPLAPGSSLELMPDAQSLAIEFSSLDFTSPEDNQYAYLLEGYNTTWVDASPQYRVATYTNLDPGTYRLIVKGSNRKGKWSENRLEIPITVLPAWHQTLWFYYAVIFVSLFVIYQSFQWRTRSLYQRKQELTQIVSERTAELKFLGRVGNELNSVLDREEIFTRLYQYVENLFDTNVFAIGILSKKKHRLVFSLAIKDGERIEVKKKSLNGDSLSVWCINNKETVFLSNKQDIKSYQNSEFDEEFGDSMESIIYLPLKGSDGQILGCLTIQSKQKDAYSEALIEAAQTLANYTAIALDNAYAYHQVELSNHNLKLSVTQLEETQKQLKVEKRKAEQATKAQSIFLANMSHEIRTPMNAILGFLKLTLENSSLPREDHHHIQIAHGAAENLLTIINEILDISKYESGKLELEQQPFNLFQVICDVIHILNVKAQEKGYSITLNYEEDLPHHYLGDPGKVRQIIINLLGNAIKFTKQGFVNIDVSSSDNQLKFELSDSGIGIDEKQLKTIFESFTQADASTTRQFGGTGLGTTISKQLVELMGGKIWVESKLNEGTHFHFTLPLTETAIKETEELAQPDTMESIYLSPRRFNILVAEDSAENAELISLRLKQQHHQLTLASNGEQALKYLMENNDYDLVLMDVQMPIMDGLTVTQKFRNSDHPEANNLVIIALTASVLSDEKQSCLDAGMSTIVTKPIDFNLLFRTMEKFVPQEKGTKNTTTSISQNESSFPDELSFLHDIADIKSALQRWQSTSTYCQSLLNFAHTHQDDGKQLITLLENKDYQKAHALLHTLHGVAGNCCLTELFLSSQTLLKQLAQPDELRQDSIERFTTTLTHTNSVINQLKPATVLTDSTTAPTTHQRSLVIIRELIETFTQAEMPSGKIDAYLQELSTSLEPSSWAKLKHHIEQFDFSEAVTLLEQLQIQPDND
ncbi:two-component regulator propeller domain-containing protein [Pleionea sp. CnH1-48]|uniref:two-component regulator propeller domain-containing protein n=1 Tax=Pleionea sp. CnH1-48 TaxID=2954494 RepID=UPI00209818C5|nr:two-component regulator propeller domain-containing protein [Pleionea sp. CnH1-48]MCO7226903.1 ATP-binding protein [Pleionea sp. CnH1-48]